MQVYKRKGRHSFFIGWLSQFQGLGLIVSFDNPTTLDYSKHINFEVLFLFFNCWYTYTIPPKTTP